MLIDFSDKTVLVTGGAGGIGTACVKAFAEAGAKVVMLDVSESALKHAFEEVRTALESCSIQEQKIEAEIKARTEKEIKALKNTELYCYPLDLADTENIAPTVRKIREELGEIDVLVQTAGLLRGKPGLELTVEEWDQMLAINARGMFFMMQQVVKQSMAQNGGSIVNFASMAGIRGMNAAMASAHYSASKGAVVAMTMQAATEWAQYGIRVNAVAPGGVRTPAMALMDFPEQAFDPIPLHRLSDPEDVANAVLFLASDKAAMITGQTLVIDGGSSVVGY